MLPRQQTLAASVDWSHDRLDELEQVVFRRLGVFAGTFPMEGAEAVSSAMGDLDRVAVFDAVSRLVDKNLVAVDERPGGEQLYRLLETLRVYALDRARAVGELAALRDAHATFWLDWLESQEPVLHTDHVIERVELFHDSLAAALDWSTRDPAIGLRLLRRLARPWQGTGRPDASLTAVDALLTDENAERFPILWAAAVGAASILVGTARSWPEAFGLLCRGQALAEEAGDEYLAALCEFLLSPDEDNSLRLQGLARQREQRYVECIAIIMQAAAAVETPQVALGTARHVGAAGRRS